MSEKLKRASPLARKFLVYSCRECEEIAKRLVALDADRLEFVPTSWGKFDDSDMDNIELGGFHPQNKVRDASVVFVASFHSNDAILSQLHVLIMLLESFIRDLTIVLPFFPMGTMERVTREGQVATANTICRLFSNLPACGRPTRVMIYDIHTLQNRFYLYGHALASLHTTVPLLLDYIGKPGEKYDGIAFPDEGAYKRFGGEFPDFPLVVCAKVRDGDTRKVTVQEGSALNQRLIIVDDLVRSGGTLYECARALKAKGATQVSTFCAHAAFKETSWSRFCEGGDRSGMLHEFVTTNSVPTVAGQLEGKAPFVVLDVVPLVFADL